MLLTAAIAVGTVAAQSPAQRAEVERFRQELSARTDSSALLALERTMIDAARSDRDNPLVHLRLGFLAYRIGEVTAAKQHYDDAASEFEWASDLEPSWAYAWYGLGLAELALGEHDLLFVESLREIFGTDALSKAANAFARAAELDPSFSEAVVDLANTALEHGREARLRVALQALRQASVTPAGNRAALLLARGRVERSLGEGDSALVAFRRLLQVGGDSGVGLLELSRALFYVNRDEEAEATYYRAADMLHSPDAVDLLRADLEWIASEEEIAAFDASAPEGRKAWLANFWGRRDLLEVRRPGERLAEHYRRYFYALRHYKLGSRHRRYDVTNPFRTEQRAFDDRGLIYLRHGEPDRRAIYNAPDVEPNESWLYRRNTNDLIFHFTARDEVSDYKLVESLLNVFGLETALALQTQGFAAAPFAAGLVESREILHPVYGKMLTGGRSQQISAISEERGFGGHALKRGTTSDSYPLRFKAELDGIVQPLMIADQNRAPRVVLAFAVPGRALSASTVGSTVAYPLELRIAANRVGRNDLAAFLDTTRVFATRRELTRNEHLSGVVEVALDPGVYDFRVLLAQPGSDVGQVVAFDSLRVPAFDADELRVSDLVVGLEGRGLVWVAESDSVSVNALTTFPVGSALSLYYQVHGLAHGTPYRAKVEIKKEGGSIFQKIFGGGRTPVSLTLEQVSEGLATRVRQSIDLSALKPGRYRLVLTIEDPARDVRHTRQAQVEVIRS